MSPFAGPATFAALTARVGARLGLEVHVEPGDQGRGQIVTPDGRTVHLARGLPNVNGACASVLADDKTWCAYHLLRMGYPVPDGRIFRARAPRAATGVGQGVAEGYRYARDDLGWPVVVKPTNGSSGAGVTTVESRREYYRAMREVLGTLGHEAALVQRCVDGNDFRIVVLDGEVLSAYQRIPLAVVGDGRSGIGELLAARLKALIERGRHIEIAPDDYRVEIRLARIGRTWASVPAAGETVRLLDTANGSTGGDGVDLTASTHPEVRALAARITRDAGLRYCGIDLMTEGTLDAPLGAYHVIELNATAALHHLNAMGEAQRQTVETIVEKMLRAAASP